MKFRTRWVLVFALATAQIVCLLAAVLWYGNWLHKGVTQLMRGQIASVNSQVTDQLSEVIDQWGIKDLTEGSDDWKRVQNLVERLRLPNSGQVSIVDNKTGEVICHPSLRNGTEMRKIKPATKLVRQRPSHGKGETTASGWVQMPDGTHYVTVHELPRLGVILVADQLEEGIAAAVRYISTPLWSFGILVAGVLVLLSTLSSVLIIRRYESKLEQANAGLEQTVEQRSRALVNTRDAVIFGLAKLADSRDAETGEHLERISEYSSMLARQLAKRRSDIDRQYIQRLGLASSLHDIGKVGIRDDILLKPGKLTADERKIMQTHATIGAQCLAAIQHRLGDDDFLDMAGEIAAAHHERWDGGGYPYGLKGDEIPLAARIVAVADVYDALTTHRCYKRALSHEEASALILAGSGTQFDPEVVDAFRACETSIKAVALSLSSESVRASRVESPGHEEHAAAI